MSTSDMLGGALAHHLRRWLFLVHRWIGIVTCLLFTIWLLSGLVMIYVPFPSLSKAERLAGQTPINWSAVRVSAEAARRGAGGEPVRSLTLEMRDRAPVWQIETWNARLLSISAVSGQGLAETNVSSARRIAGDFGHRAVRAIIAVDRDQWTVAGNFDRHRPLWKAALAGDGGRVLYVSSQTGEVVLDTNANERFWNWLGSVPHWIYPTVLRQNNLLWRQVVMWVSGPCIIGAITGLWIGLLRLRAGRRRYSARRITPYRGWMKWHHIAGLAGGTFLTTWIFSGWLSVDPGRLFASPGLSRTSQISYAGVDKPLTLALSALERTSAGAKQVRIRWSLGAPQVVIEHGAKQAIVLNGNTLTQWQTDRAAVLQRAGQLVPEGQIVAVDRLDAPDAYWYETDGQPLLPVMRVRYDDSARSWVYIDPASGAIVGETDSRRRVYRWAFDLLHKWDMNGLTQARPAWDLVLWLMSLAGLVIALSGVVIGWRRLNR
ncbi:PepSY domain-containing protein [Novosphingobium cyanobacteriorum]|uniref:PepSY domain-containing protein n=1 Tax=Novosphingobium cyanobacteriorum TaxID=3024215 RepID=A0ABT6CFM7_9SPHN|nr:PepSY domain-containing protein [Novosphingobium cyanobacteriorum]MDF8332721.1 PepSY domain-containing protein [Novosphingobium cyanobacteriorum]